ncbi:fatty acid synthesis protein, partial [Muricomes intestini]
GKVFAVSAKEFEAAGNAGFKEILAERKAAEKSAPEEEVTAPPKEVVTEQIPGIEIMDLEDGVKALWKEGIYADSGMGCTGPIILVSDAKKKQAQSILKDKGYL